ncbi:hypothetical protein [Rudanella lutea]|uniref:hypothetical protein n=1 Tax=Rudanella lutea TaxID=451374 RepID=UPI000377AA2D|nr:hypothetical protein [Rudanella lutea]
MTTNTADQGNGPLEYNRISMLAYADEMGRVHGIPMIRYALNAEQEMILLGCSAPPAGLDGHGVAVWECVGQLSDQTTVLYQITVNSLERDGWNLVEYPDPYVLVGTRLADACLFEMERTHVAVKNPMEGHLLKVARAWVEGRSETRIQTIEEFYERLKREKELYLADRLRVRTTSALIVLIDGVVHIKPGLGRAGSLAVIRMRK